MQTKAVLVLQSWFDISIEYTGDASNAFEIANANNRSITDELVIGEVVTVPEVIALQTKVLQYFADRALLPATGLTIDQINNIKNKGIGYMIIGKTFIVG